MAREIKVCTITTSNDVAPTGSNPLTLIGVEKTPTPCVKKPKTAKTFSQKSAEIFWSVGDDSSISFNDYDVDGCNISVTPQISTLPGNATPTLNTSQVQDYPINFSKVSSIYGDNHENKHKHTPPLKTIDTSMGLNNTKLYIKSKTASDRQHNGHKIYIQQDS
jgi:hypothetical protein